MRKFEYWLLSLYPRVWRKRYEEEFVALLEQYTPSWRDLLDIFFCALYEQIFTVLQKGNAMLHQQRDNAYIFRISLVLGSVIALGILITGMLLARTELANYGTALSSSLTSCFILILYAIAGWRTPDFTERAGLRYAGVFGLIAGIVFLLYNAINNLSNPGGAFNAILGNSTMIIVFSLCFIAGLLVTRATRNIVTGLLVGMWTGIITVLIGGISLGVITALFNDTIIHGTLFFQDYLRSGVQSATDFTILDCLDGFFYGLILLPIGGAFLGVLGGVLGMGLVRQQVQS